MQLNKKNSLLLFLFLGIFLVMIIVYSANAETGTYEIQPQQQRIVSINLNSGDSVSGTVVVNGEGAVDFWISDPQGNNVTAHGNTGQEPFSLNAETSGTFQLHIFNRSTSSNVNAVLNYNVVHRIFGMPQEMFLLLVIVVVVFLLIIIYAAMSKI
jgi:hypothetical protein